MPDAYNPQDYDRHAYTRNNPLRYVDPSGHWVCSISSQGEKAGITVEMCETWVNTAFVVLQLTETGQKIVDAFLNADENSEITISVGGELPNAKGNILGNTMYLSEEIFLTDPLDPNTWGPLDSRHPSGLSTFAHESIHAGQGFLSAFSAYGEAEAYYYEYQLNQEQNNLIGQYNNARDPADSIINDITPYYLAAEIGEYQGDWKDINYVRMFRNQNLPWFYSVNGMFFHKYEGGTIQ